MVFQPRSIRFALFPLLLAGIFLFTGCETFDVSGESTPLAEESVADDPRYAPADHTQCNLTDGGTPTPLSIYGAWHCGSTFCDWSQVRDMQDFDVKNHWIIDRGDGSGLPSVNLVVLSFIQPMKVLNKTTDAITSNGVPIGLNQEVVDYFKNEGIRVIFSMGGATYIDFWNEALATNPTQLGLNAAEIASTFGVGMEIDYEENSGANLVGLQAFIDAYRSVHPYDASGNNHAARLTIDLAVGNRYLQTLSRHATEHWLDPANPVLDYANAMVAGKKDPDRCQWQEHISGIGEFNPPIPPKAPAKLAVSHWLTKGAQPYANCTNFANSKQKRDEDYVESVMPNGQGVSTGIQGFMFWAAECPSTRNACTTPPNTCEGGMGVAAATFDIPIPMPALRQQ